MDVAYIVHVYVAEVYYRCFISLFGRMLLVYLWMMHIFHMHVVSGFLNVVCVCNGYVFDNLSRISNVTSLGQLQCGVQLSQSYGTVWQGSVAPAWSSTKWALGRTK